MSLIAYPEKESNNFQYVVLEIDPGRCPVNRDRIVDTLHARHVLARKYF